MRFAVLFILAVYSVVCSQAIDKQWYYDNIGNTDFHISTAAELAGLAEIVNSKTYDFKGTTITLNNNLDLSDYGENWNDGKGWAPIGTEDYPFQGRFDGNGKKINGLFISRNTDYIGLFGYIKRSALSSIWIADANISGSNYVGGIAGFVAGSVRDSYVIGAVNGHSNVGGIAGYVSEYLDGMYGYTVSIYRTYFIGKANGFSFVGGIAGSFYNMCNGSSISYNYSVGTVGGNNYVGGIVGYIIGACGAVTNCIALNDTIKSSDFTGRIIGGEAPDTRNYNLSNNAAFIGIVNDGGTFDGLNKTAAELQTTDGFQEFFKQAPLLYEEGKLPGFGSAVDMPDYILALLPLEISRAKTLIEESIYATTQADVTRDWQAETKVKRVINELPLNGVSATIVEEKFTAAQAGTLYNLKGIDGSYTFTVKLQAGAIEQITKTLSLAIIATEYIPTQDELDMLDLSNAKKTIEETTYAANFETATNIEQAKAKVEDVINELPLNGVIALVANGGTFTVPQKGTESNVGGINGRYTFTVELSKGSKEQTTKLLTLTIAAKPYGYDDVCISNAKTIVEKTVYATTENNAATIFQAQASVETIVGNLALDGVTATVVSRIFTPASNGENGSYAFVLKLNKDDGKEQTTKTLILNILSDNEISSIKHNYIAVLKPEKVRIFSAKGALLLEQIVRPNENLPTVHLPKGVYLINIAGKTFKFVKL